MQMFSSGREAKEYLIGRIAVEAECGDLSLSETERKMMYFTETAWTLPDIAEVNRVFERDYDQASYETKIGQLAWRARARAAKANELEAWSEAVRVLDLEDHYLHVLMASAAEPSDSIAADRLKLVGTALLICLSILAGIVLYSSKH